MPNLTRPEDNTTPAYPPVSSTSPPPSQPPYPATSNPHPMYHRSSANPFPSSPSQPHAYDHDQYHAQERANNMNNNNNTTNTTTSGSSWSSHYPDTTHGPSHGQVAAFAHPPPPPTPYSYISSTRPSDQRLGPRNAHMATNLLSTTATTNTTPASGLYNNSNSNSMRTTFRTWKWESASLAPSAIVPQLARNGHLPHLSFLPRTQYQHQYQLRIAENGNSNNYERYRPATAASTAALKALLPFMSEVDREAMESKFAHLNPLEALTAVFECTKKLCSNSNHLAYPGAKNTINNDNDINNSSSLDNETCVANNTNSSNGAVWGGPGSIFVPNSLAAVWANNNNAAEEEDNNNNNNNDNNTNSWPSTPSRNNILLHRPYPSPCNNNTSSSSSPPSPFYLQHHHHQHRRRNNNNRKF